MSEAALDTTEAFAETARHSAHALHVFSERTAKRVEDNELSAEERSKAVARLRDMLALELAVKFEFAEGTQFENGEDALKHGRQLLDSHSNEAAFDELNA